jgi:hypothetical protein
MKEKLYRFMMGRYGFDQFNRFLMLLGLVFFVISVFGVRGFYLGGLACLIYAYFRMLSRNTYKRSLENNRYLQYESKVKRYLSGWKRNLEQRKTHHIYKCPSCRQKIRIPRGKGKIEIRCPKCGQTFIKKS